MAVERLKRRCSRVGLEEGGRGVEVRRGEPGGNEEEEEGGEKCEGRGARGGLPDEAEGSEEEEGDTAQHGF